MNPRFVPITRKSEFPLGHLTIEVISTPGEGCEEGYLTNGSSVVTPYFDPTILVDRCL